MVKKLAVIKNFKCGTLNIETFNPKSKSWTIDLDTRIRKKKVDFSSIIINEQLYVVGGWIGQVASRSVECHDLVTTEWYDLPPMNNAQGMPTLFNLKGHLCVFGSDDVRKPSSIEIYNFGTKTWTEIEPPTIPVTETSSVSTNSQEIETRQTAVDNGILYILDFHKGFLQTYDVSSNTWTSKEIEKDELITFGFAASKGFLYTIGGYYSTRKTCANIVKRYHLATNTWSEKSSFPNPSRNIKSIVYANKIFVGDGWKIYEYNIKTNKWVSLGSLTKEDDVVGYNFCTFQPIAEMSY